MFCDPDLHLALIPGPVPLKTYYQCSMVFHVNRNQKKAAMSILISNKIDLKIHTECFKRERRTLYNDQGINPRR